MSLYVYSIVVIVAAAASAAASPVLIFRFQANPNQLDLGPHCANRAFHRSMARENTVLHCLVLHDQQERCYCYY